MLFLLIGCTPFQPAASIRVEVDVYKGPLSKPLAIQEAELKGIIHDAALVAQQFVTLQEKMVECKPTFLGLFPDASCLITSSFAKNFNDKLCNTFFKLPHLLSVDKRKCEYNLVEQERIKKLISVKSDSSKEEYFQLLTFLAEIAAEMKTQSAATSAGMIPYVSSNDVLRIAQSLFAVMSSEYGNLIGSRVDTLMIQLYGYRDKITVNDQKLSVSGKTNQYNQQPSVKDQESVAIYPSQLHLSKYLSDSNATKVPNLYEWYDAKVPGLLEEWEYFIPGNNPSLRERVRIYETIFNDVYWSNVNTVYASGVDKVNMALIRDEIGNWNLKNFENDPTELLGAYKDLTIQSIKTAIELSSKSASGGSLELAQRAANIANRIASRLDDTGPPTVPVAKYKQRVVAQLESLKQTSQAEWDAMNCKSAATDDQKTSCKEILKTMNKKMKDLLQDYSIVLDTLQEVSLPTTPKETEENVPTLKQVTGK